MQIKIFISIFIIIILISCDNNLGKDLKNKNIEKSYVYELKTQKESDKKINSDIEFLKSIQKKYDNKSYSLWEDKELKLSQVIKNRINILYFNSEYKNDLLLLAIIFRKNEVIKYLLNESIDINEKKYHIWNEIFSGIIISGNLELVKYFIESKRAKLYYFDKANKFNILNRLITLDTNDDYPKFLIRNYIKIIDYFYKNKIVSLKELTINDNNLIHGSLWNKSLEYGIIQLYKYFISIGIDINHLNSLKQNALVISILHGGVYTLITKNYVKDNSRKISIFNEYRSGYRRVGDFNKRLNLINYLLENKINVNNIDNNNKTALDYSLEILNESEENKIYEKYIVDLLKKYKAKQACEILKTKCKPINGDK
jgi:hypothetical protein